jgi:hypothetical protein
MYDPRVNYASNFIIKRKIEDIEITIYLYQLQELICMLLDLHDKKEVTEELIDAYLYSYYAPRGINRILHNKQKASQERQKALRQDWHRFQEENK